MPNYEGRKRERDDGKDRQENIFFKTKIYSDLLLKNVSEFLRKIKQNKPKQTNKKNLFDQDCWDNFEAKIIGNNVYYD